MGKIKDLHGQKFGKLTVISYDGLRNRRTAKWMCKCECGNYKSIGSSELISGNTSSCGCFKIENTKRVNTRHGQNRRSGTTSEYSAWAGMKQRCADLEDKDYGGRGIVVCERWIDSFESFFADMGPKPTSKHSLDRFPNTNGNYEPENCRWATFKQQQNNVRKNIRLTYKGETKTLSEWRDILGFNYGVVQFRLKRGYSVEEAFEAKSGELKFERYRPILSKEAIRKLVEKSMKPILQFTKDGIFVKEFPSTAEAARQTGILGTAIKNCITGLSKSSGGYVWKAK